MSGATVVTSDTHMNMTSQQLVVLGKESGVEAMHLAFNVKMSSWITLAFDRFEIERLSPGSTGLRQKLAAGLAQALRRQIEAMDDTDLNLLFDRVEMKEVRDDSDRVLLDEGGIEMNATELCAAHGIEIIELEGSVCRYTWRAAEGRFTLASFDTSSEAAINAIEVNSLAAEQVGTEAGLRALALCESSGVEIFSLPVELAGPSKFGWRSMADGENGVFDSDRDAAYAAIAELDLNAPAREVQRPRTTPP